MLTFVYQAGDRKMENSKNVSFTITAVFLLLAAFAACKQLERRTDMEPSHAVKIVETDEGFLVAEDDQKVLFYQRRPRSLDGKYTRADYVHPLYGLDGQILTEDFPADHPHHRGIFWAWHQVYIGDKRVGDSWSLLDISWDVYDARILTLDAESRALRVRVFWKSPLWTDASGQQKPFVEETTTITVHPAQGDIRKIDFEISLLALEDGVRIGGADNKKEYGGFSARIKLPDGMEFVGPAGPVEPNLTPLPAAPWMDFSGDFDGNGRVSGLAILSHKSNPGYPHLWILRRKRAMQNPVFPGREPVALSRDKPVTLRYRLIIHRGNVHNLNLDHLQAEYNRLDH
jgi:hypothetical protein